MDPQMIFERARRLYTEKIPVLIERERAKGDGWDAAAGHLSSLYLIDAITEDEYCSAMRALSAAMLEHLRSKASAIEEPSPTKSPLRTGAREECAQDPEQNTVLLVGPSGIGKTLYARELAAVLGAKNILDNWNGRDRIPADTLALGYPPANTLAAQRVIEVSTTADLMALIDSPQPSDSSAPSVDPHKPAATQGCPLAE